MCANSLFFIRVCFCVLMLSGGAQLAIAESSGKDVSGTLNVNGAKINLVHAYVDEADADEPIVVLSDKPLPAEAIPFLPQKLVNEQKVHAVAFSISSKDKKLTNTYGKVHYPGEEMGVGMGRVEDGKVTLVITRFDANMIEGRIATPKQVVFSDVSYAFDASFKVRLGSNKIDKPASKSPMQAISVSGDASPPAKAYAEYHKACIAGDDKSIRDFLTYKNQKEFDSYDESRREAVIYILKLRPEKIKIAEPVISSDKASFTVEGLETPGEKMTGSIKMIFENGKWKVSEDKWKIE